VIGLGGSGHSVVLKEVIKDVDQVTGLTYWSSQSSTNGVGIKTEYLENFKDGSVIQSKVYICRALTLQNL
jgi:hypothetical protein